MDNGLNLNTHEIKLSKKKKHTFLPPKRERFIFYK